MGDDAAPDVEIPKLEFEDVGGACHADEEAGAGQTELSCGVIADKI